MKSSHRVNKKSRRDEHDGKVKKRGKIKKDKSLHKKNKSKEKHSFAQILTGIIYAPARQIRKVIPSVFYRSLEYRLCVLIRQKDSLSESEVQQRAEHFLLRELAVMFWGIQMVIVFICGSMVYQHFCPDIIQFTRNAFGGGETELSLTLKKDSQEKQISLPVSEMDMSEQKRNQLFKDCFKDLAINMAGENDSLLAVNHSLVFSSSLDDYPFQIDYYAGVPDYIEADGSLGEKALQLKSDETKELSIHVTLKYEEYKEEQDYDVILIAPEVTKEDSLFSKAIEKLTDLEEESRTQKQVELPSEYDGVQISTGVAETRTGGILLLIICAFLFFLIHGYYDLKEKAQSSRKSTVKDFPDIVHYLTLYMGAGLSFSSAVSRISEDYQNGAYGNRHRYAYDQIVRMEQQINMGMSQKDACLKWGNRFDEGMYQKLAMMLVQSFSKGAKEASLMLDQVRRDAFRQYIDQEKRLGEEASTKLLFPMIVLMGVIMAIVMTPAIVQFQFV